MADNLPLLPKNEGICAEVRPLLRTVFRELDYLPPLSIEERTPPTDQLRQSVDEQLPTLEPWTDKFKSDCDQIWNEEGAIKEQHARRLAREPLPNIYKLHSPRTKPVPQWKLDRGLIDRADLKPTIDQDARGDEILWVKNILNASSGDVTTICKSCICTRYCPVQLSSADENTIQTLSVGIMKPPPKPVVSQKLTPSVRAGPDWVVCIPPDLSFVNFVVGDVYTKSVRLVNLSKFELRLSLTPPKHQELQVALGGTRGLTLTTGAMTQLHVTFRPRTVRAVHDRLVVRASCGQKFEIDIACYIKPPILDILIPNVSPTLLVCTPDFPPPLPPRHLVGGPDVVEMGAQLLGDVHHVHLLLHCEAEYATFFLITEDAWINWDLDCLTGRGSVVCGEFMWWPAWWRGGGVVNACVWYRGKEPGAHLAELRVLSSTAVNRRIHLMADVVLYKPNHLNIEAQPKDYDICLDSDADCEHYVNLGTAFPHRALSATIKLHNNSPVSYNYYWASRAWGVCCCWEGRSSSQSQLGPEDDTSHLCPGAIQSMKLAKDNPEAAAEKMVNAKLVSIEPGRSLISPRTSCTLQVRLPDVGERLGIQRAVFMLIIKDIPKECFPEDFEPLIVSTQEVDKVSVLGLEGGGAKHEVCEVLVAQLEVWWEVVPVKFVLEPAVLPLPHSRRLKSFPITINAWQLSGCQEICVDWLTPEHVAAPPPLRLSPERSAVTTIDIPLPPLPNDYPVTELFTMVSSNKECKSSCVIKRWCSTRHPPVQPARAWLGVVCPSEHVRTALLVLNDTEQEICYWIEGYRWLGENPPARACEGALPCDNCYQHTCTCDFLKPRRGVLAVGQSQEIIYDVYSPPRDGCVLTLVRVSRCTPDVARSPASLPSEARASLLAYRVLAPRVTLRVLPCFRDNPDCKEGCGLDPGAMNSKRGTSILRPSAALVVGRRTCYRLCLTNLTPHATLVSFDDPIDSTDILKVTFMPKSFNLRKYGKKEIRVVLDARRVCRRRVFVYRAQVDHALKPLYLLIDAAISGVQISCQLPIGGGPETDELIVLKRSQMMSKKPPEPKCCECQCMCQCHCGPSPQELFAEEDRKRRLIQENTCQCPFELVYVPPPEPDKPEQHVGEEATHRPIEFVTSPPPLLRVCKCDTEAQPVLREGPYCASLQFIQIPLRKVCERRLVLSNESVVTTRWSCHVRRWGRQHTRTIDADEWAGDVRDVGLVMSCTPAQGVLAARARQELCVRVYADCWGLYWDQILIQVEDVEPIVVDVWVHAVGPPLQFLHHPTLWLSAADPERAVQARNVSREALVVRAYVTHENDREQDELPFRLYLRILDVPAPTCSCYTPPYSFDGEQTSESAVDDEVYNMETDFELYLGPDLGPQCDNFYQVEPIECHMCPGDTREWRVRLRAPPYSETAPRAVLLLRLLPMIRAGEYWYREEPPPQVVRLRQAPREELIKLSCDEIVVKLCALDLPYNDFLRVRKRFYIQNQGNGAAVLNMYTSVPWCVVQRCDMQCSCARSSPCRMSLVQLPLPPLSCTNMSVEVCISTVEMWPDCAAGATYAPHRRETTPLYFYDNYQLLLTLPLTVEIEYPVIQTTPTAIDFGYVTDEDSRKTYVTVSHTSRTEVLNLKLNWVGCNDFKIWPPSLNIAPGGKAQFYVQYTAVWRHGYAEGCVIVCVWDGESENETSHAGLWCRTVVPVRAAPTRDHKCHTDPHDHTDDPYLLPSTQHLHNTLCT